MVTRGVYTKAEKQMIDATNQKMDAMVGWDKTSGRNATVESMQYFASYVDRWNPLWINENYGKGTRWGSMIAFPGFQERFGVTAFGSLEAVPECGYQQMIWIGEDWEYFKPIRPGDSFKVWNRRPLLKDVTGLDGKGPRIFSLCDGDRDYINQKDEVVSSVKSYAQRKFLTDGQPVPLPMPEYGYTEQEFDLIEELIGKEEIRGERIRYWEDVNIGELTAPIVVGPTNLEDTFIAQLQNALDTNLFPPRKLQRQRPGAPVGQYIKDATTGLIYSSLLTDRRAVAQGDPRVIIPARLSRNSMVRLLTNWMGDDGFLRKFNWRHLIRVTVGDTLVGRGEVISKYKMDGEYLVDLDIRLENMRGNITEAARATVSLFSRETVSHGFH